MRLLVLVIFVAAMAGCWGPSSGYTEPPAPLSEPAIYGPPTPGTPEPVAATEDTTAPLPAR